MHATLNERCPAHIHTLQHLRTTLPPHSTTRAKSNSHNRRSQSTQHHQHEHQPSHLGHCEALHCTAPHLCPHQPPPLVHIIQANSTSSGSQTQWVITTTLSTSYPCKRTCQRITHSCMDHGNSWNWRLLLGNFTTNRTTCAACAKLINAHVQLYVMDGDEIPLMVVGMIMHSMPV